MNSLILKHRVEMRWWSFGLFFDKIAFVALLFFKVNTFWEIVNVFEYC